MRKFLFLPFFLAFFVMCARSAPAQTPLTQDGKALMPIVISPNADEETRTLAGTLAEYLQKISGAQFEIRQGEASRGIVLGTAKEFAAFTREFQYTPETREDYLVRSHANGVYLIGVGKLGVNHAAWDFLYRLGYRAFFPGKNWEIIPHEPNLKITADVREHPDFLFRRIWSGSGSWPDNETRWARWDKINRMEGGIVLNTGHSWNLIFKQYQDEFDKHPEYFALVDGKRQVDAPHKKFCISNPGLRDLVGRYALDFFAKNPNEESVSIDPSDFGGWCQCEACRAIGTPSDRQTVLANQRVKTVRAKYPEKYVAFYSYYDHSPPPSIKVEPGVVVSVATSFIRGGFTFEELVKGWREKGAEIGTRDYMGVVIWDFDLPNEGKAGQLDGMPISLTKYHDLGTRFYIAEAGDSWGSHGLGYYLASRILWDVDAAKNVDALFTDFIEKAFPDAQAPMREFYQLLTGIEHTTGYSFNRDYLGRLYRQLDSAWKMSSDPSVRARIGDLVLYLRHQENYLAFREADDAARQKVFETLMRHAYRIRDSHMVHGSYYYRKGFHQNKVTFPAGVSLESPPDKDPWKNAQSYTLQEIERILQEGVAANLVQDGKWQVQLAPPLAGMPEQETPRLRGKQSMLLYALKDGEIQINPKVQDIAGQFYLTETYSVTDMDGRLIQKGVLKSETPITIPAKSGQSFLFHIFTGVNDFTFSNAAVAYRTDIYRPLLPPGVESLFFFRRGGTFYVHVPGGVGEWSLKLITQAPGETAKVTVWDPNGKQQSVFETSKKSEESVTLKGTSGFWRIEFDKAETGALYKVLLSLDKTLSPWMIVDPQHPLIVTKSK